MRGIRVIPHPSVALDLAKHRAEMKALFESGKVRIDWSQTRGSLAIFVSGRMEGDSFVTSAEAIEYLEDLGVDTSKVVIK